MIGPFNLSNKQKKEDLMKLLSVAIPCFNSQEYMRNCIESLLPGGDLVEILIINDGSSDQTSEIADEYAALYPTQVKAIHQINGGHGEAVNAGMRNATGMYFKVVDSDDWVDAEAYEKILETLRKLNMAGKSVDMIISNFVYEKQGARHKMVMRYDNVLEENKILTWDQIGNFRKGQYILMHSVIYNMDVLRACQLELPKHTFYVDNLFVYEPLPYVKTLYYINVDFYRYFIGREDQSVNEKVMIKRVDQQIRVNKLMVDHVDLSKITDKRKKRYMINYLEITTVVSSIILIRANTQEALDKKHELWQYIKASNPDLYYTLRNGFMGMTLNLPGRFGRSLSIAFYKVTQKVVGFN